MIFYLEITLTVSLIIDLFSGFYTRYRDDEWKKIWEVIARKKIEEKEKLKNKINLIPGEPTQEEEHDRELQIFKNKKTFL